MKIILCMGCWGREVEEIKLCSGIENKILDLTDNTQRNLDIKDYLDKVYRIYDRPLYNNVHTAIWNIQEKFSEIGDLVIPEKKFKQIEIFCGQHGKCGLYLRLKMEEL